MMRGDRQLARGFATRFFLGVARVAALVWLAPALLFNVDWTGHGTWQANAAAVVMILASALFIEGARHVRDWVLTPLFIVAALLLVYGNTKQAMRNLSFASEAVSEAKAATLAEGSHRGSQGVAWVARRAELAKIAGEAPVGTLEAQLKALQLSDLRVWNATSGCEDVTVTASGKFCTRVADAKAKIEAAKERDKLDARIAALPVPKTIAAPGAEAPVTDAYVANVVALLREAGFAPSERIVKAEEALTRAFLFELVAALGPTAWLVFVNMGAAVGSTVAARMRKAAAKPDKMPAAPGHPEDADDLDRCIADLFEVEPAGVMASSEIRPLVATRYEARGMKLDKKLEARLWAKMGARFKRDPNGGRPRYLGLKARVKGPPKLAVVSSA